ncbi:hypothetical protein TNCV_1775031 [Trichonephila clavipes]|nr:hypothetical protein TNCV_1775031 [Trichonephila clavipes]
MDSMMSILARKVNSFIAEVAFSVDILIGLRRLTFKGHLKSLVYEMLVAAVKDLTARIGVALADIASTLDLFEGFRQFFVRRCRLYYDHNFEKFCDNHFLHF